MTQTCEQCGKKIGVFSNDYISIGDEHILCYNCAEPIRKDIISLYSIKSIEEFNTLEAKILENSINNYKETVLADIKEYIRKYQQKVLEQENNQKVEELFKHQIANHILTTGYDFCGYKITKYVGVISGQVVLGTGFLAELSASYADFWGEESNRFADKLENAKNAAINKLIIKSCEKGGNAIIGIDFDYMTFKNNLIGVVANGTSVVIEKKEN